MSETWLRNSIPSSLVTLNGYKLIRNDRKGKAGGGIGMYIRDDLKFKEILKSDSEYSKKPEFLFVEVDVRGAKCLIGVVYRPPRIGNIADLEEALQSLIPRYEHAILMGDFNCDLTAHDSTDTKRLTTMFTTLNMTILPSDPTHHVGNSHTLLDLIITNNDSRILAHGQMPVPGLSKHDMIYAAYSLKCPKYKPKIITYRDFKHLNEEAFTEDAMNTPWHNIYYIDNLDDKVSFFNHQILNLYDRHAPLRTARVKRPANQWFN